MNTVIIATIFLLISLIQAVRLELADHENWWDVFWQGIVAFLVLAIVWVTS